jgi:hypothetical protein
MGMTQPKMNGRRVPNPLVHRPTVILRISDSGWTVQFAGSRYAMSLPFGPTTPLRQVVEHLRERWPNARIALDEVVLEDHVA